MPNQYNDRHLFDVNPINERINNEIIDAQPETGDVLNHRQDIK